MDMKNLIATVITLVIIGGLFWLFVGQYEENKEFSEDIKERGEQTCTSEGQQYLGYSMKKYGASIGDINGDALVIQFECYDTVTGEVNLVNWRAR